MIAHVTPTTFLPVIDIQAVSAPMQIYMDAMTALGRRVMETMALSLGLELHFFSRLVDAEIGALHNIDTGRVAEDNAAERWDGSSVHAFEGSYGDYLINEVSHVFPDLRRDVL